MKTKRIALLSIVLSIPLVLLLMLTTAVSPPTVHAAPTAVLTVCASGCDHTTITAAIAAATADDTITVMDAVHTEQGIVIDKNLTIQGQGADSTIVQAHATAGSATDRVFTVNSGVTATIQDMTIRHGKTSSNGVGGGIYIDYDGFGTVGALTVNNSTISGNSAGYGGGIQNSGTLTVNNSTISGNSASINGGGILNYSADGSCTATPAMLINNSTISSNSASNDSFIAYGGGILNGNGVIEINHSTITTNTADDAGGSGGGVWSYNDDRTCTRVGNSIIAGNSGGDVTAHTAVPSQRFFSLGYNLIGTAGINVDFTQEFTATGDMTNTLPLLGALANNGGDTLTHALLAGSPAIDAGDCSSGPATDQRSAARPQDSTCDIGAYEKASILTIGTVGSGSVTQDPAQADYDYGTVVTVTAVADAGWTFAGWSGYLSGSALSGTVTITGNLAITATFDNDLPTADAGGNQVVPVDQSVTLDGSGSFDNDPTQTLTYGWTQTGGTSVSLSSKTAVSPTFTTPATSTVLTFTLTVTDSYGLASTADSVTITVQEPEPYTLFLPVVLNNYVSALDSVVNAVVVSDEGLIWGSETPALAPGKR